MTLPVFPPSEGIALLKRLEGCRLKAYLCQAGIPTIGWGHTEGVKIGSTCTQVQADAWLLQDAARVWAILKDSLKVKVSATQSAALLSFAFNIGPDNFRKSTLLKRINDNLFNEVPEQMSRWVYITQNGQKCVSNGLVKRRATEIAMWLSSTRS